MNEMTCLLSFGLTAGITAVDGVQFLLTIHNGSDLLLWLFAVVEQHTYIHTYGQFSIHNEPN